MSTKFVPVQGTREFTKEEIEDYCENICRKLIPSYRAEDDSIDARDLALVFQHMNWERSPEQITQYVRHWDKQFNGRMPIPVWSKYMETQHDRHAVFREYAISFDKNKDGFISEEEFNDGLETLLVHDPGVKAVNYDVFLKEADLNADGKISIEEMTIWLDKMPEN